MTTEIEISNALTVATTALAASIGISVKYPDVHLDPPADNGRYLAVTHLRNSNGSPTWGSDRVLQGIWQIDIVDPKHEGEIPATVIAGQILDVFAKNAKFWSNGVAVQITAAPSLLTVYEDDKLGHSVYPVSIPYRLFEAG